jgi:hypothetical protein
LSHRGGRCSRSAAHFFAPVGGWTANQIHQAVLTTFHLSDKGYGLNQLRYDLRKLRAHGLIERDGSRCAYRLTLKGVQEWGHVTIRMCGYPPFGAQVILNGHEWVERLARRKRVVAVKNGNCFIEGSDFAEISRLSAELNRVQTA